MFFEKIVYGKANFEHLAAEILFIIFKINFETILLRYLFKDNLEYHPKN